MSCAASDESLAQITRSKGKSFVQLLTSKAVLIAFALAGAGGGIGSIGIGAVDTLRRGGCRESAPGMGSVAVDKLYPDWPRSPIEDARVRLVGLALPAVGVAV